jgi:hypothetical protein
MLHGGSVKCGNLSLFGPASQDRCLEFAFVMNQNFGTALRHGNVRKGTARGIGDFPHPEMLDQVLESGRGAYLLE